MRGIIFDLDDTLYPMEHFRLSGFGAVARHVEEQDAVPALRVFDVLCTVHRHNPGREYQALAGQLGLPASRSGEWLAVHRSHAPAIRLEPGVADLLARLRSDGWRLGILTNGDPATQRRKLAALGVLPLVDACLCAEEHALGGKPARACFEDMRSRLGTEAHRTVHVGDDPVADVGGARRAGMKTVRVRTERCPAPLPADADLVIDAVEELAIAAAHLIAEDFADVA